ncbi:MAG: phosphodiester glycosidase family protein [Chloroflexota bacterium]
MHHLWVFRLHLLLGTLLILIGCERAEDGSLQSDTAANLSAPTVQALAAVPTEALFPPTPLPSLTPIIGTWIELRPGLERFNDVASLLTNPTRTEEILVFKIDPAQFQIDVGYTPGQGRAIAEWAADSRYALVVNGGFFTDEMNATGLIVSDGVASGRSYTSRAGMFKVYGGEEGSAQRLEIIDLDEIGFVPDGTLWGGIQTFPLLVGPSGVQAFQFETVDRARRTAVGIDKDGMLLFIFATTGRMTLTEFSAYLASSELEIDWALNLDGGSSSSYVLQVDGEQEILPALVRLPSVILVSER